MRFLPSSIKRIGAVIRARCLLSRRHDGYHGNGVPRYPGRRWAEFRSQEQASVADSGYGKTSAGIRTNSNIVKNNIIIIIKKSETTPTARYCKRLCAYFSDHRHDSVHSSTGKNELAARSSVHVFFQNAKTLLERFRNTGFDLGQLCAAK